MPAPTVHPLSLEDIDRYQAHRKHWVARLGMPGLLLIGISTLLGIVLQQPTPVGITTGLVGFAMVIAFGVKLTCPACGKTPINRQTSWNPDACGTCGTRLKR